MASSHDTVSMAVFCDFENVALGVRDAQYEKFDIKPVLERLLLKGSIVVKKAYCDWERYKSFKAPMHEANFELIEIPHVRQSGKNSADIRLVVDALDLCYTKSHVNTFVIISGDSDFSPLVSKLRENAKQVIGVGVKQSTSDLLIANCDEFIFYDDLVRESQRAAAKRNRDNNQQAKRTPEEEKRRKEEMDKRRAQAVDMVAATFDALMADRSDTEKLWASVLKEALKRRNPGFNESYYGFRAFGSLLDEAKSRGLLEIGRDEKSGTYVCRPGNGAALAAQAAGRSEDAAVPASELPAERAEPQIQAIPADAPLSLEATTPPSETAATPAEPRRGRGRGTRGSRNTAPEAPASAPASAPTPATPSVAPSSPGEATLDATVAIPETSAAPAQVEAPQPAAKPRKPQRQGTRTAKTTARARGPGATASTTIMPTPAGDMEATKTESSPRQNDGETAKSTTAPVEAGAVVAAKGKAAASRKPATRSRRPRKKGEGEAGGGSLAD